MLIHDVEINMDALYQKYSDDKVKMIKEVRELTGLGLKEAKEAVDAYIEGNNPTVEEKPEKKNGPKFNLEDLPENGAKKVMNDFFAVSGITFTKSAINNIDDQELYEEFKDDWLGMVKAIQERGNTNAAFAAMKAKEVIKNGKEREKMKKEKEKKEEEKKTGLYKDKGAPEGCLMYMAGANGTIALYQDRITIKRRGIRGALGHGFFQGEKDILISSITAVQLKKAGPVLVGYIQFSVLGGVEAKKGLNEATSDENTVTFDLGSNKLAEAIKNKIYELKSRPVGYAEPVKEVIKPSGADELLKYKQLLDAGILTQEEFDEIKKKILFD